MPQGGIYTGETLRQAALRELKEEVGSDRVEIRAECRGWFHHDVPDEIAQGMMGGRYRGNRQKWFAMRFTATDADINLATEHAEFNAWEWVRAEQLPALIVPFGGLVSDSSPRALFSCNDLRFLGPPLYEACAQ